MVGEEPTGSGVRRRAAKTPPEQGQIGGLARRQAGIRAPGPTPSGWPLDPVGNGGARLMVTVLPRKDTGLGLQVCWAFRGNGTAARPVLHLALKLTELEH